MSKLLPAVIVGAVALTLAACGRSTSSAASAPLSSTPAAQAAASSPDCAPLSSTPAAQAAASSPDCAAQVSVWATTGGGATLPAFSTDTAALGESLTALAADEQDGTAASDDTSAVQTAAASMQSDAQALQASPGPACLPGLAPNVSAAAKDFDTAAIDATNSVNQLSAGNVGAATGDLQAATAAEDKGNAKIDEANTAVKNFSSGS
jgi:hypothetical protein